MGTGTAQKQKEKSYGKEHKTQNHLWGPMEKTLLQRNLPLIGIAAGRNGRPPAFR